MNRRALLIVLAIGAWGSAAATRADGPAIHPAFEALCVQGTPCAAPAVVRLDAHATTADGVARPFHDLRYAWDCGDGSKPIASPISACVYEKPGKHGVTLTVHHGDESATKTLEVVVADRSAVHVVELAAGSRQATVALGPGPGLLTTKGTGAPAVITGPLAPLDGWTIARVDFEGACTQLPPERSRISFIDVEMRGCRDGGVVSMTGGGAKHSDRIALVRTRIHSAPEGHMSGIFLRAERAIILDSVCDGGLVYCLRTVHFPGLLLARTKIESLGANANAVQLRAWGGSGPPNTDSIGFVIADNTFIAATPGTALVRTCQTNTCDDTGPGVVTAADVRDGLFERNTLRVTGSARPPPSLGFWLAGGDLTVRDNVLEAPNVDMTGPGTVRFVEHLRDSTRKPGLAHDRITVERNRAVLPEGARAVKWLEPEPGTGHVEQGNALERASAR